MMGLAGLGSSYFVNPAYTRPDRNPFPRFHLFRRIKESQR